MISLSKRGETAVAIKFPYDEALVAAVKNINGRRWDNDTRAWVVPLSSAPGLASFLRRVGTVDAAPGLVEEIVSLDTQTGSSLAASRATDAVIDTPAPEGLAYLPYQRAGIAFARSRPGVLIADEMGLGKTIQSIGIANDDPTIRRVLVICPASLKVNWSREISRWSTRSSDVYVGNGTIKRWDEAFTRNVQVEWLIVNYDILAKWRGVIDAANLDLLVVDEAHYIKNPSAQRSVAVLGKWVSDPAKRVEPITARRRVFLTGTPILNRPVELWGIAHSLAPNLFPNWRRFVTRYCAAYQGQYGWDTSGASNLDELQSLLRGSVMVRRLKADVLTDLPPKRWAVVELPANGSAPLVAEEVSLYDSIAPLREAVERAEIAHDMDAYNRAVEALRAGEKAAFTQMADLRHRVALAKLPLVISHLRDSVEQGKVVCFAWHRDVVDAIKAEFPNAAVVTGDTPVPQRQVEVDRFQNDPECRLFVGNIRAAGVGLTLTASSHVVFAELDWTPANVRQAEDRCHRIGQRESILVQHLVLEGSLDARMARTMIGKQQIADASLDNPVEEIKPVETPIVFTQPDEPVETPIVVKPSVAGPDISSLHGGYAVENEGGELTFIWIDKGSDDSPRWSGCYFVEQHIGPASQRMGMQRRGDTYRGLWPHLLEAILADPKTARETYGKALGKCGHCGLRLTNAQSRERGIGPVCAASEGW